jgi:hypothetical protein
MAGGSGCVVDGNRSSGDNESPERFGVPGSSLPVQERKGGGFKMRIYFYLRFRSLFGLILV